MEGILGTMNYVYNSVRLPLGKTRCIRIIKIRPETTNDLFNMIVCDFSILDVENGVLVHAREASQQSSPGPSTASHTTPDTPERVEYQALSYTWGDLCANHIIELNGTPFRVRENLWDFLYRARAGALTGYLWIDAICIDQTTVGERNHQVSIMGEIYSQAEGVIVWLGDCSVAENDLLFECFNNMCNWKSAFWKISDDQRQSLSRILRLPYWSRAWIMQEYYLARRKDIWYGSLRLTPQNLDNICSYVSVTESPAYNLWCAQQTLRAKNFQRDAIAFRTFSALLEIFRKLKCADGRDKLFALLPLLSPEERKETGILPDYSKSTTSLFVDVTIRLVTEGRKNRVYIEFLREFPYLEDILDPDFQDVSVRSAILDFRDLVPPAYGHLTTDQRDMDDEHHQCHGITEPPPFIGNKGCLRCQMKPVVTFRSQSGSEKELPHFSRQNWKTYVHALLSSEDEEDRITGIKFCRDPGISQILDLRGPDSSMEHIVTFFSETGSATGLSSLPKRNWQAYIQALLTSENIWNTAHGGEYWVHRTDTMSGDHTSLLWDTSFPNRLGLGEHSEFGMRLQEMLKWFTRYHLSKKNDLNLKFDYFPAYLGDLLGLKNILGAFISKDDNSLLARCLLWHRALDITTLTLAKIVTPWPRERPSWSWTSYTDPIDYFPLMISDIDWQDHEWPRISSYSPTSYAYIEVEVQKLDLSVDNQIEANIIFDIPDEVEERKVKAVVLGVEKGDSATNDKRHYILAVIPMPIAYHTRFYRDRYKRVGSGYVPGRCLIGRPEPCTLC